jgi:RimJ/RimL family protein N-acetyltransferase
MLSPYIYGALAHERHQTFLAQAETDRRARQARLHRQQAGALGARRSPLHRRPAWLKSDRSRLLGHWPRSAATGRPVVLRDGSTVLIRQVQSADAPLLADGFARLSARSRQLRFLTPKQALSPAELRYFTDVDHHDHEALGALYDADGRGVGIARYVRDADDSQAAEIAVTIIDDWQGRGLGTELMAQLSERARSEGIRRFTALVAADNPAMAGLLRRVRADFVCHDPGALRYEILLGPAEQYRPAGVFRSSDDPPGRLADPAAPESASVTMVTETHRPKARRGADRVWSFDSYSGWAQRRAGAAGLVLSAGSRMKAVVRWAKYRIALRGCDRSAARGSVARGGPGAEGSANDGHSCLWGG